MEEGEIRTLDCSKIEETVVATRSQLRSCHFYELKFWNNLEMQRENQRKYSVVYTGKASF